MQARRHRRKQTHRQQTHRHTDTQTHRHTDTTHMHAYKHTPTHTHTLTHTHTHTHTAPTLKLFALAQHIKGKCIVGRLDGSINHHARARRCPLTQVHPHTHTYTHTYTTHTHTLSVRESSYGVLTRVCTYYEPQIPTSAHPHRTPHISCALHRSRPHVVSRTHRRRGACVGSKPVQERARRGWARRRRRAEATRC